MKVTITPIAVATIAPAILATAAAAVLPFAQPGPALASTHAAAHQAPATHTASTKATVAHHAAAAAHTDSHATTRHHRSHRAQASASEVSQQTQTSQAQQAQQSQAQQSQQPQSQQGQGSQAVPAGMSSFEQCVAWRESTDTPTDPDGLFGILPSTWAQLGYSGTAGQASVAVQQQAFNKLYAEYGAQPWAPSDGC
jgi:hypothetical protein